MNNPKRKMVKGLGTFVLLALCILARAESTSVDVGDEASRPNLGYGWSHWEGTPGGVACWTNKRESDLKVTLDEPEARTFRMRISPCVNFEKDQNVALYINNRFVKEWVLPRDPAMAWYEAAVPATFFKASENTVTFRVGYIMSPGGGEKRKLGICVDKVEFDTSTNSSETPDKPTILCFR
jgi:hypothetical protein